jgi:hypothetical protein
MLNSLRGELEVSVLANYSPHVKAFTFLMLYSLCGELEVSALANYSPHVKFFTFLMLQSLCGKLEVSTLANYSPHVKAFTYMKRPLFQDVSKNPSSCGNRTLACVISSNANADSAKRLPISINRSLEYNPTTFITFLFLDIRR